MIKVTHPPDPWQNVTTANGFAADEVISALQKSLRRSRLENAILLGWEMFVSSAELEEAMWSRLCVIAVEDVGNGDPQMPVLIETLYQQHRRYDRKAGDRFLFAAHAIRRIAGSDKDRTSDDLVNWARHSVTLGERLPEIPDIALDMHTRRGQEMGRGYQFFMDEGSKVSPESAAREQTWRRWIMAALEDGRLE